jgi:heavy-metal resistance protein
MLPGGPGVLPVERVLNDEQRRVFREEMQSQRERLKELNEKASKLRPELDEALFAEKLDEKLVRDKVAALAELEADRSLIRARALAKVRPTLSEEQLTRLKNLRAELAREGFRGPADGRFRGPPEGGFRGPPQDFRGPGEGDRPPGDRPGPVRPPRRPGGFDREERDPLPPPTSPPPPPPPPLPPR